MALATAGSLEGSRSILEGSLLKLLVPTISVIAMTVAACLAVLGYRFARLPGWRDQRWFWLLAASASLYAAFNVVVTLDVPTWVVRLGAHGKSASMFQTYPSMFQMTYHLV